MILKSLVVRILYSFIILKWLDLQKHDNFLQEHNSSVKGDQTLVLGCFSYKIVFAFLSYSLPCGCCCKAIATLNLNNEQEYIENSYFSPPLWIPN